MRNLRRFDTDGKRGFQADLQEPLRGANEIPHTPPGVPDVRLIDVDEATGARRKEYDAAIAARRARSSTSSRRWPAPQRAQRVDGLYRGIIGGLVGYPRRSGSCSRSSSQRHDDATTERVAHADDLRDEGADESSLATPSKTTRLRRTRRRSVRGLCEFRRRAHPGCRRRWTALTSTRRGRSAGTIRRSTTRSR